MENPRRRAGRDQGQQVKEVLETFREVATISNPRTFSPELHITNAPSLVVEKAKDGGLKVLEMWKLSKEVPLDVVLGKWQQLEGLHPRGRGRSKAAPPRRPGQRRALFFNFKDLDASERYKLMAGTIVPRPIALVVSRNADGRLNAAPFSFFNMMSFEPPLITIGICYSGPGNAKDTGGNIRRNGQFVVNLVSAEMAQKMNITAVEFGPETNEIEAAGFATAECKLVGVPRITESPVSFECERHIAVAVSDMSEIVIGRVLAVHLRDDVVLDLDKRYIDTPKLDLIARMHGKSWYTRSRDLFEVPRISVAEWNARMQRKDK